MQSQQKHYKVVLTGTDSSGKTSLFNTLFDISQSQNSFSLETVQSTFKFFQIEGKSIHLEVLNTPGSSQYETLRHLTYKGSQTLVFVADITDQQSLEFMSQQIQLVVQKQLCSYDCSAVLIGINPGGKERFIKFQEISMIGNMLGFYHEVSINEKQKIQDIFKSIALQRIKFDNYDESTKSMMQKIQENIDNPLMQSLKDKINNKNQNQEKQHQKQQQAAPAAPGSQIEEYQNEIKESETILIKSLLIGDSQVGKTAMCMNYLDKIFPQSYNPTIGVDFRIIKKPFGNKTYKLQIWDTAGLSKFQVLTQAYYKEAKISFFVYDITKQESFNHVKSLINNFQKSNDEKVRYRCLVGNKTDLIRCVSSQQGMALAQQLGTDFVEISAKNRSDLKNLFTRAIQYLHKNNVN